MDATSQRWQQVTPSQYAWEANALDVLRNELPDSSPYRAWTNFEFTDGGRIHEADALVVTPKGVYLIEIKSWSGRVSGNQGTWVQERLDGSRLSFGNPAALNQSKVRSLASLIKRNWRGGSTATQPPYIESLVWFSNDSLRVALPPELHGQIAVADGNDRADHIRSITNAIIDIGETESERSNFRRVTPEQSDELAATMARIGFKESNHKRTAGSYELQLPAFAERGSTQDFFAKHSLNGLPARVRIYSNVANSSPDEAKALKDAADREYMATQNLKIDGVVRATDVTTTDFGPAVVFEHHPTAIRLDRFLAERDDELDTDARLGIIEAIAITVREMHRRRISHRMLTPESVWLRPARPKDADGTDVRWEPQISDFSLAARESPDGPGTIATYTRVGSLPVARTGAVDIVLADPAMATYLAPETFTDPDPDGVSLDAFSIGALTYLLFAGQPPAPDRTEIRAALGSSGLSVSAVVPEIDPRIEELVRSCTNPVVSDRLTSLAEILDRVALARGTTSNLGESDAETDPLSAQEGDVLAGRFVVRRRLGKGSTAVALWCRDNKHERDVVLKVASRSSNDERLQAEAQAIDPLRQANVVELYEQLRILDRQVLVLSFAGAQSLAGYLRAEGPVGTDFLRRWGEDLLEAIRYLEKVGVAHRDIKPDNLGIVEMGPSKQSHLVLFDFSLAGARADDLSAGTPGYLDPFLEDKGRGSFDLAAERYAAAVTIHEMATGETPTWGDGRTNPSYLPEDVQPTILVEAIDPEVRAPIVEFLTRALQRDATRRFDTADDMARAWLEVFADWDRTESGDDPDDSTSVLSGAMNLPDKLSLDDPITTLPTTRKVRSALRKVGAETVRGVARLDAVSLNRSRGVAVKTRRQVLRLRAAILERFAEELASEAEESAADQSVSVTVPPSDSSSKASPMSIGDGSPGDGANRVTTGVTTPVGAPTGASAALQPSTPLPDLDRLGTLLLPPRAKRGRAGSVNEAVRALLGLNAPSELTEPSGVRDDWPTVASVAARFKLTPAAVSQTLNKARKHWSSSDDLMAVAGDLLVILGDLGGVAGVSELAAPLIEARGTGNDPDSATRLASAVIRAVVDSGSPIAELFTVRRSGARNIIAIEGSAVSRTLQSMPDTNDLDPVQRVLGRLDRPTQHTLANLADAALVDLAVQLGRRADELVEAAPLVAAGDVIPALRSISPALGRSLSDARLVRLAAGASDDATTNSASDLVRRDASAVDALRWSRAALVSARSLSIDELVARVSAKFPSTELPLRPELDQSIEAAELRFQWNASEHLYESAESAPGGISRLTSVASRQHTLLNSSGVTVDPDPESIPPDIAEAIEVDRRLDRSIADGGFLALRVPTDRLVQARRGLARFQNGNPAMANIDLESLFLQHLRANAEARGVAWSNLEGADDPSDSNWARLSILAGTAVDLTIADVAERSHVIAWYPGALVRHAPISQTGPLDRLRDAVLGVDHPLHTLWLIVIGGSTDALPNVDGTPVPTLAASQWMSLSDAWLANMHRSGGDVAAS